MPPNNPSCLFTRHLFPDSTYLFPSVSRKGVLRGLPRRRYYFWETCRRAGRRKEGTWNTGITGRLGGIGEERGMTKPDLKKQYMSTKTERKEIAEARPSSSIILLSPRNEILLLHRVKSSSAYPSAHVFPGGNLSSQDGVIPNPDETGRHEDGGCYRMAAVRECFEECGILLARKTGKNKGGDGKNGDGEVLEVGLDERERARKEIHAGRLNFGEWIRERGGVVDLENLIPFTRWITPPNLPRRFTTQMYIYFLPLSTTSSPSTTPVPTHDGGLEHTTAEFHPCTYWLTLASQNKIILFPPQYYLLHLLAPFLTSPTSQPLSTRDLQKQRDEILSFLEKYEGNGISWARKVISPKGLMVMGDGRSVLGLESPGPELEGSGKGGDGERVVLVKFGREGPRDVEVRDRKEVVEGERGRKGNGKL